MVERFDESVSNRDDVVEEEVKSVWPRERKVPKRALGERTLLEDKR